MNIFKIFSWPGRRNAGDGQQSDFTWDELPQLAQLHIIEFLDRTSLNNMRQISTSARFLSENYSGIHVIIPARNWTYPNHNFLGLPVAGIGHTPKTYPKKSITDSIICHIVRQMEGKKIKILEMSEMPPSFTPFRFEKLIQYPAWLRHVKMKYLDVEFINDILTKCRNLISIQYTSSLWRPLPSGIYAMLAVHTSFQAVPVPANNDILLQKINTFPNNCPIRLDHLRNLSLVIGRMSSAFSSDWGNVTFILLALPVLPSLKKFNFEFRPNMKVPWKIHFLILSCVAEFLSKIPNLQVFKYHSTFDRDSDVQEIVINEWTNFLRGLINKFGSNDLKEIGDAAQGHAPRISFRVLVQQIMNAAATKSLGHLDELDITLGETSEHSIFSGFVALIRSRLTKFKITDLTRQGLGSNIVRRNVYRLFTVQDQQVGRLTVHQSITHLKISCVSTRTPQEASLTRILGSLPELKELEISLCKRNDNPMIQIPPEISIVQGNADPAIFSGLEKICFQNVNVRLVPDLPVPVLCHFKNIRELEIENDTLSRNFTVRDLAIILASLQKLNKIHAKPVVKLVNVPPQEFFNLNYVQDRIEEDESMTALGDVGTLKHECTAMFSFSSAANGILSLCAYYDFLFEDNGN